MIDFYVTFLFTNICEFLTGFACGYTQGEYTGRSIK